MPAYLASRLFSSLWVIFGVSTLVFFLIHWIPGDPVEVMLGESASSVDREVLRQSLGLHLPLFEQWWNYMSGLFRFDLGVSLYDQQPVSSLVASRFGATFELAGVAFVIAVSLAIPLGIVAAAKRNTGWDIGAMGFSLLGVSIPNFWLGPLLVLVFSLALGWLPVSGREGVTSIILPAITLGTGLAAILSRMVRSSMLEILQDDFMRTARAKGLSEMRILLRHGLRNACLPILTVLGLQLGALLGGAVVTETVFNWPGIGLMTVEAIQRRDYPLVQGCILLISLSYVLVNLFTDIAYAWIDPRIRLHAPSSQS